MIDTNSYYFKRTKKMGTAMFLSAAGPRKVNASILTTRFVCVVDQTNNDTPTKEATISPRKNAQPKGRFLLRFFVRYSKVVEVCKPC